MVTFATNTLYRVINCTLLITGISFLFSGQCVFTMDGFKSTDHIMVSPELLMVRKSWKFAEIFLSYNNYMLCGLKSNTPPQHKYENWKDICWCNFPNYNHFFIIFGITRLSNFVIFGHLAILNWSWLISYVFVMMKLILKKLTIDITTFRIMNLQNSAPNVRQKDRLVCDIMNIWHTRCCVLKWRNFEISNI